MNISEHKIPKTQIIDESLTNRLLEDIFNSYSIPLSLLCFCKASLITTVSSRKYISIIFPKDKAYGKCLDYSRVFYEEKKVLSSESLIKDAIYGNEILFNGDINYEGKGIVYSNINTNIESTKNIKFKKLQQLPNFNQKLTEEEESKENYIIKKNEVVLKKKIPPGQSLIVLVKNGTYLSKGDYIILNRKGSHIIVGLLKEISLNDRIKYGIGPCSPTLTIRLPTSIVQYWKFTKNFTCQYQNKCFDFLNSQGFDFQYFDNSGNRCYCNSCFPDNWVNYQIIANEKYIIPRGWCRFGLKVPYFFSQLNDIWGSWCNVFHGTEPSSAKSIIEHKTLLLHGDLTSTGERIGVKASAKEYNKFYTTPHICYASHPWYSDIIELPDLKGEKKYAQVVLAIKIRKDSYYKQCETEGGKKKIFDDYSIIPEDEIEWYSNRRGCIAPYGILVRIFSDEEKTEIERLAPPK